MRQINAIATDRFRQRQAKSLEGGQIVGRYCVPPPGSQRLLSMVEERRDEIEEDNAPHPAVPDPNPEAALRMYRRSFGVTRRIDDTPIRRKFLLFCPGLVLVGNDMKRRSFDWTRHQYGARELVRGRISLPFQVTGAVIHHAANNGIEFVS
jgi:hypothetical protein